MSRSGDVYPWFQAEGLSRCLDSLHVLKAAAKRIHDSKERGKFRLTVQRSCEHSIPSAHNLHADQTAFMLRMLLASTQGRENFFRALERHVIGDGCKGSRYLASRIQAGMSGEYRKHWPSPPEITEERSVDGTVGWFLNLGRFVNWLRACVIGEEAVRPLAFFAATFAMLQPEIGPDLHAALWERDERFHAWTGPKTLASEPGEMPRGTVSAPPGGEHLEATPDPQTTAPENPAAIVAAKALPAVIGAADVPREALHAIDVLKDAALWRNERTLRAAHQAHECLIAVAEVLKNEIDAVRATERAADAALRSLVSEGVFPQTVCIESLIAGPSGESVRETLSRLSTLESGAGRVQELHRRWKAMADRVQEHGHESWAIASPRDFDELEARLTRAIAGLEERIRETGRRREVVTALLERLESSDHSQGQKLVGEADAALWLDVVRFQREYPLTANQSERLAAIAGDTQLPALLLALLWTRDRRGAVDLVDACSDKVPGESDPLHRARLMDLFGFLTHQELVELAHEMPRFANDLGEWVLTAAIRGRRFQATEYLNEFGYMPAVDPVCRDVFRAVVICRHRRDLVTTLDRMRGAARPRGAAVDATERARQEVLEAIERPPGMSKTYQRLRVLAREHYLLPLRTHVEQRDSAAALRAWKQFGGVEAMVARCLREVTDPVRLENKHVRKTTEYVDDFAQRLELWAETSQAQTKPNELDRAFMQLEQTARRIPHGPARRLSDGIRAALADASAQGSCAPPSFGLRAPEAGCVALDDVSPAMLDSWIAVCRDGVTALDGYVRERMLVRIGAIPSALEEEGIRLMVSRGEYEAARQAARRIPALEAALGSELARRREQAVGEYKAALEDAHAIGGKDDEVALWLEEVERNLAQHDYAVATENIATLAGAVLEFKTRGSSEYDWHSAVLRDAGEVPAADLSLQQLRLRVQAVRSRCADRRAHLQALRTGAELEVLPDSIRHTWARAAQQLDTPARWPDVARAARLAKSIAAVVQFVVERARRRGHLPAVQALLKAVESWLPQAIREAVSQEVNASDAAMRALNELEEGIELGDYETSDVLKCMRDTEIKALPEHEPAQPEPQLDVQEHPRRVPGRDRGVALEARPADPRAVVEEVRAFLNPRLTQERPFEGRGDAVPELKRACRALRIPEARTLAAHLALHEKRDAQALNDYEIVYGLTWGLGGEWGSSSEESPRLAQAVCLAAVTALCGDQTYGPIQYFGDDIVRRTMLQAMVLGMKCLPADPTDELQLGKAYRTELLRLPDAGPDDASYRWFCDVVQRAEQLVDLPGGPRGSIALGEALWEFCTLARLDPVLPRTSLLVTLERMRFKDVVVGLAQSMGSDVAFHVKQFLAAVFAARANPAAWDEARRVAQAFHEQVGRRRGARPWTRFIDALNRASKERSGGPLCAAHLVNAQVRADGTMVLDVLIEPAPSVYLESATISIGSGENPEEVVLGPCEVLTEGAVTQEHVVKLEIPPTDRTRAAEPIYLPYRLCVRTTSDEEAEFRDQWPLASQGPPVRPLTEKEINMYWPGCWGDPITSRTQAFHGRESEKRSIDACLSGATGRQRSAVIIGQRRIGKTSLLVEVQESYPPSDGKICGVYVNLGGMSKDTPDEPLARTIFRHLTTLKGDPGGHNQKFCSLLRDRRGKNWDRKVTRGVDPAGSLANALTHFVESVSEETGGRVDRLAWFVDEFQSIFAFDEAEVNRVMWALRPLVQDSRNVSLILAGSGLTRRLIADYDQALFGSVQQISLQGFSLEHERDAVADTFIPPRIRSRLCPPGRDLDSVVTAAHHLCGGHPWYLSALGASTARRFEARPFSRALVNEAARLMVRGDIGLDGRHTSASWFYGHLFEALDFDPRRQAIAKLLVANIARQVTLDWPWLTVDDAIHGPALAEDVVSEAVRLDTLGLLRDEGVLERKKGAGTPRVRIDIPILAEALKRDADDYEHEARLALDALSRSDERQ